LSGDERIRDPYLGGGEHSDEMNFGDRPLHVDSRGRSNVSNAQIASFDEASRKVQSTFADL
jgi:hypothetical protein